MLAQVGNEDNLEEGIADKCQPISPEWPADCCHRFIAQCWRSLLWLGDCWQQSGQDVGQDSGHNSGLFLAKSVASCYTFCRSSFLAVNLYPGVAGNF